MGGGGVSGTLLGGIVDDDAGVAGVGALSGAGLTTPVSGGTLVGAAELWDPGRKAGSELRIEGFVEVEGSFRTSAKKRCCQETCQ